MIARNNSSDGKKKSWLFHEFVSLMWFPVSFAGLHSPDIFAILIAFLSILRIQLTARFTNGGVEILIPSLQLSENS